jgi:hypothetical protein
MPTPTLLTAGDTTTHLLGTVDINEGTTAAPDWHTVQYVEDYDLQTDNANMVDATVFADGGYTGQDKTGTAWQLNIVLNHMIVPGTAAYHETHTYLENHGVGKLGAANRIQLRMYDWDVNDSGPGVTTPQGQAYTGFANYSWPGFSAGKAVDPRMVSLSFLGKGKLVPITHPYLAGASVPVLFTVSPASFAAAGGTPFRLTGSGFTGTVSTTGVKFGGVNATSWTVWSDTEITGVAPAHSAGSGVTVVVTNATGASTTGPTVTYV